MTGKQAGGGKPEQKASVPPSRDELRGDIVRDEDAKVAAEEAEQIADEDEAAAEDAGEGRIP
jgi:hypothetical protein